MTPEALAAIHADAFTVPRPWSAAEFAEQIARADTFLIAEPDGFLLGRVVADEAELLTLAVAPAMRRRGLGARLVAGFLDVAEGRGAATAFLEVAADNDGAIVLYRQAGFAPAGRRRAYYAASAGSPVDALVMSRAIGRSAQNA